MAHSITLINKATDTFDVWVNRCNEMANTFTVEALTSNTNANGAFSTGNSYLFGIFGSNTITVFSGLRGGNVQTSNVLTITSNVFCNAAGLTFSVGNTSVNTMANNTTFIAANGLATASLTYNTMAVGANVKANSTTVAVGNSSINTLVIATGMTVGNGTATSTQNCSGFYTGTSIVNSSIITSGANVYANTTSLFVGNATVNVVSNSSTILLGGNVLSNQTSIAIGNSSVNVIANSSAFLLGGNTGANQTHLFIGNSTVNVVINSSSVSVAGSGLVANASKDSVAWENTLIGTRSRVNFVAGNNVFLSVTDNSAQGQVNVQINAVATSGAAIIGGTNSAIQFNDGMNFGGDLTKLSFDKVNAILTCSNTCVSNVFQLSQSIIMAANVAAFVGSTGPDTVEAFNRTSYRTVEYLYSIKNDNANGYQGGKLLIVNDDDVTPEIEEYAVNYSNAILGSFSSAANATHILIQFTPASSLSYTCKSQKTCIPV